MLVLDSSEFEFNKKTEPIGAGVPTENGSKGSAVSSVSINSISQTSKKTIKNHILLKALIVKIYQGGLSVEGHKIFVVKKGKSYSPMATQFAWMNKETDVKELCRLFSV